MRISDWSSDVCSSDLFAWERNISHLDDSWRLGPRTTACFAAGWLVIGALAGLDSAPGSAMVVVPGLIDRKSVVSGKSVSVRVDLGGRRIIKKKNTIYTI